MKTVKFSIDIPESDIQDFILALKKFFYTHNINALNLRTLDGLSTKES